MLKFIRRKLRELLLTLLADPNKEKPKSIECWVDGEIKKMGIRGTRGLHLVVFGNNMETMVSASQALDSEEFWEAWDAWNPHTVTYADGRKFNPVEKI